MDQLRGPCWCGQRHACRPDAGTSLTQLLHPLPPTHGVQGLSAYPFGRVHCTLELGSWSYGPWFVNVTTQGKVRRGSTFAVPGSFLQRVVTSTEGGLLKPAICCSAVSLAAGVSSRCVLLSLSMTRGLPADSPDAASGLYHRWQRHQRGVCSLDRVSNQGGHGEGGATRRRQSNTDRTVGHLQAPSGTKTHSPLATDSRARCLLCV